MIEKICEKLGFRKCVVIWLVGSIVFSAVGNWIIKALNLNAYLIFLNADMKEIWGYQITILGVLVTIFLYFLDHVKERRLGMSYKYIFFHKEVLGVINVFSVMLSSMFIVLLNFLIAYILSGINNEKWHPFWGIMFILNLLLYIWFVFRLMGFFVLARYKESLIYLEIRKRVYKRLKKSELVEFKTITMNEEIRKKCKEKLIDLGLYTEELKIKEYQEAFTIKVANKIKKNRELDCTIVKESKEYDSYFGDSVLTLFALYFADPKEYKALLECIAVRVLKRKGYGRKIGDDKELIKKIALECVDEMAVVEDLSVIWYISENKGDYYKELKEILQKYKRVKNEKVMV